MDQHSTQLSVNKMKIETEKLYIRSLNETDKNDYFEIAADPVVRKYLGNGKPLTREQAEQIIVDNMQIEKMKGYSRYAVILKKGDIYIGYCGYASLYGNIDFGWQYAKKYWNNGYGTEAAKSVLKFGTDILKFPLIVSFALPENKGSLKIMKKIGMSLIGEWIIPGGRSVIRYEYKSVPSL